MRIVSIHQPNFFPWLGYFDKIARSDIFVFLDHVQFPKTGGGVWSNRVKMLVGGEARWVTAPIRRSFHGVATVNEIEWADEQPWRSKLLKTLSTNYGRAPYFSETMDLLIPLIEWPDAKLSSFNIHAIKTIAGYLGIPHEHTITSSQLQAQGAATDLLIEITQKMGGTTYMCGGGASGYQLDDTFKKTGITLMYQHFAHPNYPQLGNEVFVAGLSIVDVLMNIEHLRIKNLLMEK